MENAKKIHWNFMSNEFVLITMATDGKRLAPTLSKMWIINAIVYIFQLNCISLGLTEMFSQNLLTIMREI